jgi:chromosome segregation ATPase
VSSDRQLTLAITRRTFETEVGAMAATLDDLMLAIKGLNDRMDRRFDAVDRRFDAVDAEIRRHGESIAELRGEVRQMSVRISDVNARLPIPIAYSPPEPKRSGAG